MVRMVKILLVEDNEQNRDMLSRRLERKGFTMLLAVNGREGIAKALEELPDLVLMDMDLPDIDGWEATRIIRQDSATGHIPVMGLSAHAMSGDHEKALAAGCDDYDTKPIDMPRLLDKINTLLAARVGTREP